jgi:hypothetical protein
MGGIPAELQFWGSLGIAAPFVAAGFLLLRNLISERALDRAERAADRERLYQVLDRSTKAHEATNLHLARANIVIDDGTKAIENNTTALKQNSEALQRVRMPQQQPGGAAYNRP